MRKLMFGAAGYQRSGWESFDKEVDIAKPMPFPDACASHIHAEHVIEHVTHQEAWKFFEECHRILAPKGKLRVAIPDICLIWDSLHTQDGRIYQDVASPEKTKNGAMRAALFCHGHQAMWDLDMLEVVLEAIGFTTEGVFVPGGSHDPEFCNIEQHHKVVGREVNAMETTIIEATK